jgi:hypothetical protein
MLNSFTTDLHVTDSSPIAFEKQISALETEQDLKPTNRCCMMPSPKAGAFLGGRLGNSEG